jgi:hypothetical protein
VYLDRSSIEYAKCEVGTNSDTVMVSMTNNGLDTLRVSNIALSTTNFRITNPPALPLRLGALDTATIGVAFTPQSPGNLADSIMVSSNDTLNPIAKITLSGRGVLIGQAQAGVMYATSGNPSQLYTINPATGAATAVGPTGVTEIDGLAIRPSNKELYGILTNASSSTLYRMSQQYGDALFACSIAIPSMRAITFSIIGDTLYAGTTNGRLYRINIATGDTTYIGTATGKVYSGFAISPTSNQLWASVRSPLTGRDSIFIVNRTTGATTGIGRTGLYIITPYIAFNKQGNLFALIGSGAQTNTLYSLDTLTATGTLIGSTNVTGLLAIALRTDSTGVVGVGEKTASGIPTKFELVQNYPNPFNPATNFQFSIANSQLTILKVFDVLGREVATLVNEVKQPGTYAVQWDANNVASGIYFYRLQAGEFTQTKKLILLR